MDTFLGYFIFINLGNGCLGSKYGNTFNTQLVTESATMTSAPDPGDPFIGEYASTWLDAVNPIVHNKGMLKISWKVGSTSQYSLLWRPEDPTLPIMYYGEAMQYDGQLIGSYWNQPVQDLIRRP